MKLSELKTHNRILILGYGVEGKAIKEFLESVHPSATIGIGDKSIDENYLNRQKDYDLVIKSPGIPKEMVTIPYTTATNIFFANIKSMIIGVTGTKGKSTTVSLIGDILRAGGKKVHIAGNIGRPLILYLLRKIPEDDLFVVELSSYQLDDIQHSPHIAVFLNIFPDHMHYHGSSEKYFEAKSHIVSYSTERDYFIYNPDYPKIASIQTKAHKIPIIDSLPFDRDKLKLLGSHNIDNVCAALTVSQLFKINQETAEAAVSDFRPLPHRLDVIGVFRDITFIDDGAATTPESTIQSLSAVSGIDTLFVGGQDRGYDFTKLCHKISELKIPNIVAFPDTGEKIVAGLDKHNYTPHVFRTSEMGSAVKFAFSATQKGKACLLSSASPSYSLWESFTDKGNQFREAIESYDKKTTQEKNTEN